MHVINPNKGSRRSIPDSVRSNQLFLLSKDLFFECFGKPGRKFKSFLQFLYFPYNGKKLISYARAPCTYVECKHSE